MKISLPLIACGLITLLATVLFFHTALHRHATMAAWRRSLEATTEMAPLNGATSPFGSSALPSRQLQGTDAHPADLQKRVMTALALPASLDRARAMLALMKNFTAEDFRIALDAFPASLGGERSQDFTILYEEWVTRDPEAAMKYAAGDRAMQEVAARIWVDSDAQAALAWAKGNPDVRRLGAVIARLARQDPALALDTLGELPSGEWRIPLAGIVQRGGGNATEEILKWLEALEDPAARSVAAQTIFQFWPNDLPQEQKFALLEKNPDAMVGSSLQQVLSEWNKIDPAAALDTLDRYPAGEEKRAALGGLVEQALADRESTTELLTRYSTDIDDRLLADSIDSLSYRDGALALERSALIRDPEIREKLTVAALSNWAERDEAAAREWMDANSIATGIQERVTATLEKRRSAEKEELLESGQAEAVGK